MLRRPALVGLVLAIALLALNVVTFNVRAQKKNGPAVVYAPPTVTLAANPSLISSCSGDRSASTIVQLDARAFCPAGTPITYSWQANAGRIQANGPTATWDLAGLKPGYYKAKVAIDTGSGTEECEAFASTTVLVRCTPPPPPVCPNVSIICPDRVVVDQPITFTASFVGGSGNVMPTYKWRISAGRIIEGQGTPTITVDTKGLGGQAVRADFSMGGYPTDCAASCVVEIPPQIICKKFDEFPDIPRNDEKARLDNFAIELQTDPTSTAFVVVHPGTKGRPGDIQKHTAQIVDYLVNSRGFDARRIVTIVGQTRAELMIELVTCPQGARFDSRVP